MNKRLIKSLHNQYDDSSPDKDAINFIIRSIKNEPEKIWNSTELHFIYTEKGGYESNISRFMKKITDQMQDDIYCFKPPGISSIVIHKSRASATFKLVQTNEAEEDIDATKLADKVKSEMKQLNFIKDDYPVLSLEEMLKSCCPTLITFLSLISSKFANSKWLF